jgi:hypothetical protein
VRAVLRRASPAGQSGRRSPSEDDRSPDEERPLDGEVSSGTASEPSGWSAEEDGRDEAPDELVEPLEDAPEEAGRDVEDGRVEVEVDGRADVDGRAAVALRCRAPVLGVETVRTGGAGATVVVCARSASPGPLPTTAKVERRSPAPTRPPPSCLPNMSTLTVTRLPGAHL